MLALLSMQCWAFKIENEDGIEIEYTKLSDKTVEVAYNAYKPGADKTIVIPETVTYSGITYNVTAIGSSAFRACIAKTITIPESVTEIKESGFYLGEIKSITIPESVTSIGKDAFSFSHLKSITIPGSVRTIGKTAFSLCDSLISVTILEGMGTTIDNEAFFRCKSLNFLTLPKSVTSIGAKAFSECPLASVIVEYIAPIVLPWDSDYPFFDIVEASTLYVPVGYVEAYKSNGDWNIFEYNGGIVERVFTDNGIKYNILTGNTVEVKGFANNSETAMINIPPTATYRGITYNVTAIGTYAFNASTTLKSIVIPESVTSIKEQAFNNSRLSNITFSGTSNLKTIGREAFSNCAYLTSIAIPESVTSIGYAAFAYTSLVSMVIPEGVTSIGQWAFTNCEDLVSITIPGSVTSFGPWIFANCSSLVSVTATGSVPATFPDAFPTSVKILYVPVDSEKAYSTATFWKSIPTIASISDDKRSIVAAKIASVGYTEIGKVVD